MENNKVGQKNSGMRSGNRNSRGRTRGNRRAQNQRRNMNMALNNRRRGNNRYFRRNRLERAQGQIENNGRRGRKFMFRRRRRFNDVRRKVFVKGLPKYMNSRMLFRLFRDQGRLINTKIFYNQQGYSRGLGLLYFQYPRDAWKAIQRWNQAEINGYKLTVTYHRVRRPNNSYQKNKGSYYQGYNNRDNYNYTRYPRNNYNNSYRGNNSNGFIRGRGRGRGRGRNDFQRGSNRRMQY